jgi:hypothetical protein
MSMPLLNWMINSADLQQQGISRASAGHQAEASDAEPRSCCRLHNVGAKDNRRVVHCNCYTVDCAEYVMSVTCTSLRAAKLEFRVTWAAIHLHIAQIQAT